MTIQRKKGEAYQAKRPGSTRSRWLYKNDLYFGLDEYFQLCEDLGAEPVYTTSAGISADEYNPRYAMIHDSILAHYPEMKIMYNGFRQENVLSHTSGNSVDYVDEHFYLGDLSGLYHKYDSIDPSCKKICVAEYASSIRGNGGDVIGNFGDALGDAVFMLGCERNSERMWWTGYGNYAGLIDHGNFGPCIVWNDAVSSFASPSYYMQKMLFTDNQGTHVLPFTQNTTNCYLSASLDIESGKNDILLKVANNNYNPETVTITLNGADHVSNIGHSTTLTAAPETENSIGNPTNVIPSEGTFVANNNFQYLFPAYSVTVLRIGIEK